MIYAYSMASNASKDENGANSLIGVLNSSGELIITPLANPTTHRLHVADDTTGTNNGPSISPKDNNFVTTIYAVSSHDGTTPVPIYCDINGNLLITSH